MFFQNYIFNLGQLFESSSILNPKRSALIFEDDSNNISFKELNELSNRIANYLLSKGLKIKDVITIDHDKSGIAYSLMIACLKIGVIYANIDPNSPKVRLNKIFDIAKPKLHFTFKKDLNVEGIETIFYNHKNFENTLSSFNTELPIYNKNISSVSPAYLMFTSGSTGFPKGVLISHQSVINFIFWVKENFQIETQDLFTSINPPYFDNSVFDFYGSLFNGSSLLSIDQKLLITPKKLIEFLNIKKPTIWFSVPSMLVYILNLKALKSNDIPSLKKVIFGGEGFPKNQLRKLWNFWGNKKTFINVYGPTECTCICSSYKVMKEDLENNELLPLGPIASNFEAFVTNKDYKKLEHGEVGELLLGGPNVGIGYINNSSKTNSSFINSPFEVRFKNKLYKTGDLVQYNRLKNVFYFKGRIDNQIKKMGYRIELEEIEIALSSITNVLECGVISEIKDDKTEIIAFFSAKGLEINEITKSLRDSLPYYMIPDRLIKVDELPKNQNGKIDKMGLKKIIREK